MGCGWDRAARAAHRDAAAGAAIAARSFGGHRRMRQRCRSPSPIGKGERVAAVVGKRCFYLDALWCPVGSPNRFEYRGRAIEVSLWCRQGLHQSLRDENTPSGRDKTKSIPLFLKPPILFSFATKRPYRFSGGSGCGMDKREKARQTWLLCGVRGSS